jgi:hypothetical protein
MRAIPFRLQTDWLDQPLIPDAPWKNRQRH